MKNLIYKMLTTNTGISMLDSGGDSGRAWQRNQKKTIQDFENEPVVDFETIKDAKDSSDIDFVVSLYHHLNESLELDDLCKAFNKLPCKEWDSETYGTSQKQIDWLIDKGLNIGDSWNSYNGESNLSQVLQGANVSYNSSNFEYPEYILLQIHNGADVRGGYTDAKLFKVNTDSGYFDVNATIFGTIDGIEVETSYDGNTLRDSETHEVVPVTPESKIELSTN